jgi:hypothetical protein
MARAFASRSFAATCLLAFTRGERGDEAFLGAFLVADVFDRIRAVTTPKKKSAAKPAPRTRRK